MTHILNSRRLFFLTFWTLIFIRSFPSGADPDVWWHLKTGQLIVSQGLLNTDPFSYMAHGQPWLNHEWLAQVLIWLAYSLGGLPTLFLIKSFISTATLWIIHRSFKNTGYVTLVPMLFCALTFFAASFSARPGVFTYFFLACLILITQRTEFSSLNKRWLYVLPLLMILWANMHAGFLAGIGYLAVCSAAKWINPAERHRAQFLSFITFLCIMATLINPFTYNLWIEPVVHQHKSSANMEFITEWFSPNFHSIHMWPFFLLFVSSICVWSRNFSKKNLEEPVLLFVTGFAGFFSVRHIPFFALVSAPIFARHLSALTGGNRALYEKMDLDIAAKRITGFVVLCAVILMTVLYAIPGNLAKYERDIRSEYPVEAVDFIKQHGMEGKRVFNNYDWGGYLIWRDIPVLVDGRCETFYKPDFMNEYFRAFIMNESWKEFMDK